MNDINDFKYNLTALKKCDQYWDEMKPAQGGRLCEKCQRKIVDFSKMTYSEIAFFMAEKTGPVCGFYLPEQLPQNKLNKSFPYVVGLSALLATGSVAKGQKVALHSQDIIAESKSKNDPGKHALQQEDISNKAIAINGIVQEFDTSTQQYTGIGWATIIIKGTKTAVACDAKGNFKINYQPFIDSGNVTLIVSAVAFKTKEFSLNYRELSQYDAGTLLLEKFHGEMTEFYVYSNQSWIKRTWIKITKPFRKKVSK